MAIEQYSYEGIKTLAKNTGRRVTELLVLAQQNDPFYAGTPTQREQAEWFAALWQRFGYDTGVHLRRVHYRLVSQEDPRRHDGTPYENTEGCWDYLCSAGKMARYLGLVAPDAFEDHRNPAPQEMAALWPSETETSWSVDTPEWALPEINTDLAIEINFGLPAVSVGGYDYDLADQPYHLEIWIEKSTMDDVLLPVCRELGINLVTSLGFQSITSVVSLLQRIHRIGKPARILYISDFDPAGDGMPVAAARQLEYWRPRYAAGSDVKLTPIALTREQVGRYRLPRIPVKDTDRRKAGFEIRYGEGAVELDALEAIEPGELARIVRQAAWPYRDRTLARRLREAEEQAREEASAEWDTATDKYRLELAELEARAVAIVRNVQAELMRLNADLQAELGPVRERLEFLRQAVEAEADVLTVALPDRPEPDPPPAAEDDWLFDAGRDYVDQLAVYKARKGGSNGAGADHDAT